MKGTTSTLARIAAMALFSFSLVSSSFAATNPLNNPRGLAVDAKGNLWVANYGANNVIVFNPSYGQVKAKTITTGISAPTGVAFDPSGNLWVSNYASSSVTEYTSGVQQTGNTITNNISAPGAIAVDGVGDIWVQNAQTNVTLYTNYYNLVGEYVRTYNPPGNTAVYGVAAAGAWAAFGGNHQTDFLPLAGYFLAGDGPSGIALTGYSLAYDSQNDEYVGNLDKTVGICSQNNLTCGILMTLPFVPTGIAVDNARGRLYFADQAGNEIQVYSTSGTLLHTIN